jgi:hypothetical protein
MVAGDHPAMTEPPEPPVAPDPARDQGQGQDPVLQVQRAALTVISAARMLLDALEGLALDRDRIEKAVESGRAAVPSRVTNAVRDLVGDLTDRTPQP